MFDQTEVAMMSHGAPARGLLLKKNQREAVKRCEKHTQVLIRNLPWGR